MTNAIFTYKMTQVVSERTPFVIVTNSADAQGKTLYYDRAFSSLEEALLTCREIIKSAKTNGFIEINTRSENSHTAYVFQQLTEKTEFSIVNQYNTDMENKYDSGQLPYTPGYHDDFDGGYSDDWYDGYQ